LNFPAYYIFIPQISHLFNPDTERGRAEINFNLWCDYVGDKFEEHNSLDSLIDALEFKHKYFRDRFFKINYTISSIPWEFLTLLCYVIKHNNQKVIEYCDFILNHDVLKNNEIFIRFVKDFYVLDTSNPTIDNINKILSKYYSLEDIKNFEDYLFTMNFEKIKLMIKQSNEENEKEALKKIEHPDFISDEIFDKMKISKQKMKEKYSKNIPNQNDLSVIFDFVN
jgi:hypothetical protein